jgi:arylsulfatase A-like enzyme
LETNHSSAFIGVHRRLNRLVSMRGCCGIPLLFLLLLASACRRAQPPAQPAEVPRIYRFDDQLTSDATVSAPQQAVSARVAEPVVWKNFDASVSWGLLRGRMGLRQGDLILQGDDGTPVILSPKDFAIDWGLYESVRIRMMAEGGQEVKLRIGPDEFKKPLGPPGQFQVYRFDVNIDAPRGSRPLAIMPTDSLTALVAIDFIELAPRKARFTSAAGRQFLGKRDEYRNVLYAQAPSTVTYEVRIPRNGRLHFGLGIADKQKPVTFRVLAGASSTELFRRTVADAEVWEDAEADLSSFAGQNLKLVFETRSDQFGAVGLWANPLLTTATPKARPNVLLYLVCTLRPDHTSLYGYARDTTPFLKKFGAGAVVFEDSHAQAPWTKASVPAMMTSLHTYTTGLVRDTDTIPAGVKTFAERMRAAGYVTASVVTNPFAGKASGLQRGFDYMMEYPVVHRFRSDAADRGTDSAALNKVLFPWLEQHRHEPFFLYAHATDPHAPYRPPAGFEEKWANPADTEKFNRDYTGLRNQAQYGGGAVFTRANCKAKGLDPDSFIRKAIDRYDGEILHNDHSLELLVDKLRQLGILDNTLVIVVSDHGEEFWEHGYTAHGHSLYHELTHNVFLMWNPKLLAAPKRIQEPVQLIDLMPTVLELLDIPADGVVQGQSLVPLIKGQPFRRQGYVASSRFAHPSPKGFAPEYSTDTFALLDQNWKFLYRTQAKRAGLNEVELYDRRTDRAETRDVAAQHPEVTRQFRAEIERWIDGQRQVRKLVGPGGTTTLDPESIERLRSLGYLGGKKGN